MTLRKRSSAVVPSVSGALSLTLNQTLASRSSATSIRSTEPTLTPAIRTSSPGLRLVASVNSAA
jgi:hypothetical protein